VQRESGVDVIVFDLPIQHNPIGACYNGRYPTQANAQFRSWLQTETDARGLEFWDLHDLLPSEQFDDTIHPSKSGHIGIANELARRIEAHLRTRPMRNPNDPRRSP
jgi:lysophospholipase L1-like esterase